MKLSEILRAGKVNIATRGWCQGDEVVLGFNNKKHCAATAVGYVPAPYGDTREALRLFERANGIDVGDIADWNDAPERTLAEVLAAYDKAITAAEEQEKS